MNLGTINQPLRKEVLLGYRQSDAASLRLYRTIVQLIAATTTEAGLKVRAELDENKYPKGVKVSDLSMAAVNLTRHYN